ncbi:MAG: 6-pyruvoyl tetrahydrobiopterin synthase [Chloroflexota bacterium]
MERIMGFKITVEKCNLRFSAFGGQCERLHGHNYALSLTVEGPLTADSYVYDFGLLKETLRRISYTLDHRFLLPLHNPHMEVQRHEREWEIRVGERRYLFPAEDVLALPVDNITAERLAEYIWGEVAKELRARGGGHLTRVTVGVEESPGQTAFYSQALSELD